MATVSLDEVKGYIRSEDEDDALVTTLIEAAEEYLSGAGCEPGVAPESLYKLAVKGIVLHWYENRNSTEKESPSDFEGGIRLVINQLKQLCQIKGYGQVKSS